MKKILGIIIFNLILVFYVILTLVLIPSEKKERLQNLKGLELSKGLEIIKHNEAIINYVESDKPYDIIVKTEPSANSFIDAKTIIKLYVSLGEALEEYPNYLHQSYNVIMDDLLELKNKYNLKIVVDYKENMALPEGLITEYKTESKYINASDTIRLTVIKNNYFQVVPNFVGLTEEEAIREANRRDLKLEIILIDSLLPKGVVLMQSINPQEEIKIGTTMVIYVAK